MHIGKIGGIRVIIKRQNKKARLDRIWQYCVTYLQELNKTQSITCIYRFRKTPDRKMADLAERQLKEPIVIKQTKLYNTENGSNNESV